MSHDYIPVRFDHDHEAILAESDGWKMHVFSGSLKFGMYLVPAAVVNFTEFWAMFHVSLRVDLMNIVSLLKYFTFFDFDVFLGQTNKWAIELYK